MAGLNAKRKSKNGNEIKSDRLNKFAVIIAARNEEVVIEELLKSIKNQKYLQENIDVFVAADNCTDDTAKVARNAGAIVKERFNEEYVGKGYALNFILNIIKKDYSDQNHAGYFVLDADNLLDEN